MAKQEMSPDGSSEPWSDLYEAKYEGALVDWQYLRYAAQNLHQTPSEYTLLDYRPADEPIESTTVIVSSRNDKFSVMAEIILEPNAEYVNRTTDIIGNIDLLRPEILAGFGLTKTLVGDNFMVFDGASSVRFSLFVDEDKRQISIYNSLSFGDVQIEVPNLAETNCVDALQELIGVWLIAVRESEKTVDYKHGQPSELSFKVLPKKFVSKEAEQAGILNLEAEEELEQEEEPEHKILLDDIGGNVLAKRQLLQLAKSFNNFSMLKKWGAARPNGILLHGPTGTGKTMLVEAFANEIGASLTTVQASDFRDKMSGNSEKFLKEIFDTASETTELSVLFFDELDGIISDSPHAGHTHKSEAAIFKLELPKLIKNSEKVIVMAATNDLGGISEALIRPGRFDIKIAVNLPTEKERAHIFGIKIMHLTDQLQTPEFSPFELEGIDMPELAACAQNMSGADIEAIINQLLYTKALQESETGKCLSITQREILAAIIERRTNLS